MDTSKIVLENLIGSIDSNIVFLCSIIILSTFFVLCFLLSVFLREYNRVKRAWFLFLLFGIYFLERALIVDTAVQTYSVLTLSLGLISYAFIFMVRVRKPKATKEQKELARLIDKHVNRTKTEKDLNLNDFKINDQYFTDDTLKKDSLDDLNAQTGREYDVDFEHVKTVIDKLEYYGLSSSDKKQVQDLSNALNFAEKNGFSPLVKSKINDGLGALLKIMSKYGV